MDPPVMCLLRHTGARGSVTSGHLQASRNRATSIVEISREGPRAGLDALHRPDARATL